MSNTFEKTLREMRRGASLTELSEELARLVEAVLATSKAGTLTYKLTISPCGVGGDITVSVEDDIVTKIPRPARGSSIFFAGKNHVLQREDPRQSELPLAVKPLPAMNE